MREHLINQIKEMLGSLANEIVDIDYYLENKSEKELKAIIKRIKIQNKLWVESKRRYLKWKRIIKEDYVIE